MQQKLFATSRVVRDLDAEDNLPPMASIERDRKMKVKPPAGKRGHQVSALVPAHPNPHLVANNSPPSSLQSSLSPSPLG